MESKSSRKTNRQVGVSDYRYKVKRKNNPDAGLATYNFKEVKRVKYNYDPHLDPQLRWSGKEDHDSFEVDTVSLHIHERISTQAILTSLRREHDTTQQVRLFAEPELPMSERIEFYQHEMDWSNRLILGDSLLVVNSLLEREMMAGKVQMIYMDPPYGIGYNSNFQPFVNRIDVKDSDDDSLTREPEQILAYRDTWTLGVHSYLSYLRDRLLLCRELLAGSGSIFVQMGVDNVHFVRCILDEIFGRKNFMAEVVFVKGPGSATRTLDNPFDLLLWYAKDEDEVKYRKLFAPHSDQSIEKIFNFLELSDGTYRRIGKNEESSPNVRRFAAQSLYSKSGGASSRFEFDFQGRIFVPPDGYYWGTNRRGLEELRDHGRLIVVGQHLRRKSYLDDFPLANVSGLWADTTPGGFSSERIYVVQTNPKVVERCISLTTDPGDLVFDPTCGSGTTALSAEKLGRRWITCDTSRVALTLARQRLMTSKFDYYTLVNPEKGAAGGFRYQTLNHITLKSIAKNVPPKEEVLYDKPVPESGKVRVSGPFTVEAIPVAAGQEPLAPRGDFGKDAPASTPQPLTEATDYIHDMIELLRKSGITFPGGKTLMINTLRPLASSSFIHAEGETEQNNARVRVAVSLGPRYGPVTVKQVDESTRLAYRMGFDMLVFAGFAFDSEAIATMQKNPIPKLAVRFANVSPDVIVGDLLKTPKGSHIFTVFGEPDIRVERVNDQYVVRLFGVDVYDPVTGEPHNSDGKDVPAWFLDADYDGLTFRITQAFFPKEATRKDPWDKLANALHNIVDKDRMQAFRGLQSLPFSPGPDKRIAVKVIDIRGNEVMVVKKLE